MGTGNCRMRVALSLAGAVAMLASGLVGPAQAGWVDNFDQATDFDPRWGKDIPNGSLASITLDTANDLAHFEAYGNTDMWTTRHDAPILWTPTPAGDFALETHVAMSTSQDRTVSGITVYGDGIGSDDGELPNFTFGLDHWSAGNRMVKLQGLGTNNPAISVPATGGEAWLRLELLRDAGAGGLDRYIARYKLHETDPWQALATLDRDVNNARIGLVQKTGGGGRTSDFSYAALEEIVPPPPPARLWSVDIEPPNGTTMTGVEPLYGHGNVWNSFPIAHHPGTTTNPSMALLDSEGNPTPVTFTITGTVSGYAYPGTLMEDYLFLHAGNSDDVVQWAISGLTPGHEYEMYVYGSHIRPCYMAIDTDGDGNLDDEGIETVNKVRLFDHIVADPTGVIIGTTTNMGAEVNWSGFQLAEKAAAIIPEPATLALLALGLLPALRRRNRR